ncbi:hypothetical protein N7478_009241 [Penicillium angulare]|uniref:uncharacterized protein n=1 Tax=Penicillium angulare TaxID=116970 RepID=UPI002542152F|nr:uncharacterized protein N7478_009241 [Penicillium angulare]KAJ5274116.1 hypothetical protein N7478_009241 [Penicillium angulare]
MASRLFSRLFLRRSLRILSNASNVSVLESQHGSTLETWKQFEQVAHVGNGSPKVMSCDADTDGQPFSQEAWNDQLLQFITTNRLPFQFIENPAFRRLITQSASAPALSPPTVPSADTIRHRLSTLVKERQQDTLKMLPEHAKVSVALDCWTSPFGQAFMAITGYFIDADWVYREVLLGFKPLYGTAYSSPKNQHAETQWSERQMTLAKANAQSNNREIPYTLQRIRDLTVFIWASPQRREPFLKLQLPALGLILVQDVKVQCNSTFLMLRRAKRIRSFIVTFCEDYNYLELALDDDQWRQIDYLLCLTKPFFDYTLSLSKTRDVTSHLVLQIYNLLFEHIERSKIQLQRKRVVWKKQMLISLEASHAKLRDHFKETDHMRGHIYALCTMISPDSRFQFFLSDDWSEAKGLRDQYRVAFRDVTDFEPLSFWREDEFRFPAITALARDVLAIPATGAGVESLFKTARDICHYPRGSLKPHTVEELMLYLCTSRFNLEVQEAKEFEQFLISDDIQVLMEEKYEQSGADDLEIEEISDTKEQGDSSEDLTDIDDSSNDDDATITAIAIAAPS